jgi:UTP:GlnB (protein PII) uridylyltransferase
MPVRKFFDNTFGNLLNDALFKLQKQQSREPDNEEIFTKEGMIKIVGMYVIENLPEAETRAMEEMSEHSESDGK